MRFLAVVAVAALAATAPAQIVLGEMGFQVKSPTGGTAGDFCWGFDCTPRPLNVRAGETLDVVVRAPRGAPFVVAAAANATSCLIVPGLGNAVVLDPPLIVAFAGKVSQPNAALVCYDGFEKLSLPVPIGVPLGAQVALQAVAVIGTVQQPATGMATSSAVQINVH